ncbi:transposase [Streptomyces griseoviridis]
MRRASSEALSRSGCSRRHAIFRHLHAGRQLPCGYREQHARHGAERRPRGSIGTRPCPAWSIGGCAGQGSGQWGWIVPDGLWESVRPSVPPAGVRPQGGGVADIDGEAVFAAIVHVLVSGCAWRALPPCFGASRSTVHRRFAMWSRAGAWVRPYQRVLQPLDEQDLIGLSRAVLDSAHVRAKKEGALLQVRAPWSGVGPVPGCTSCRRRTDCPYASGSPRPTSTTARP